MTLDCALAFTIAAEVRDGLHTLIKTITMPRKIMRRFMPNLARFKGTWVENVLGNLLHDPYLLHLNRRSVSLGVMIGLFWAFTPIPTQMIPAAICAWIFRANLPISMGLVWISNPFTIPPIFIACYWIGAWLLDLPPLTSTEAINMEWIRHKLSQVWAPILVGSLTLSLVSSLIGFLLVRAWWISSVRANWAARRKARAARLAAKDGDRL